MIFGLLKLSPIVPVLSSSLPRNTRVFTSSVRSYPYSRFHSGFFHKFEPEFLSHVQSTRFSSPTLRRSVSLDVLVGLPFDTSVLFQSIQVLLVSQSHICPILPPSVIYVSFVGNVIGSTLSPVQVSTEKYFIRTLWVFSTQRKKTKVLSFIFIYQIHSKVWRSRPNDVSVIVKVIWYSKLRHTVHTPHTNIYIQHYIKIR